MNEPAVKTHRWMNLLNRPGWLIVLAVCLVLAMLVIRIGWRYQLSQNFIAEIEQRGCRVTHQQGGPEWLRSLLGDRVMKPFDLPCSLYFVTDEMRDADFQQYVMPLNELQGIKYLFNFHDGFSNTTIQQLSRMQDLEKLEIHGKNFDDEALSALVTLKNLHSLSLDGTSVSNAGLRHLSALNNLESLSLSNTNVTDDGVEELQKRLPGVDISDD